MMSITLKTLATITIAVMTCGTTILLFMLSIGISYIKNINRTLKEYYGAHVKHTTQVEDHEKRITRIEDRIYP